MSHLISVQLDVLGGLLAELRALGAELDDEQRTATAAGRSLEQALAGPVGDEARLTGGQWTGALAALAARTLAVAATLDAALAAYRAADLGLAGQLAGGSAGRVGTRAVPR
ncbi:hypothetical protein [Modestobacter versicolor]|uniref:Uncharacterized protein n=1 Tax=Modestobacter versicolor TaxID=429133 RepID=A0A323V3R4_9ACTN|nr:hypothetical protein [Modestobacter versicolor]MBB3676789.1 hypothetical protein [Modestobacter versicolor]PZA19405.1 hypothetical protein DMO24_20885 [Modestobacter versicolor]